MRDLIHRIIDAIGRRMATAMAPTIEHAVQAAVAARTDDGYVSPQDGEPHTRIDLDFPVTPKSRFGHGLPDHPEITAILERGRPRYRELLADVDRFTDEILDLPNPDAGGLAGPSLSNPWLPLLDIAALYTLVSTTAPATFLEVGSGTSTLVAARAIRKAGLPTQIVSIDPSPRREIDELCDRTIRSPFESTDLSVFEALQPGDLVFIDNSHRALPNSDATVFFLEALPRIPSGVLLHVHDIFLPADYPPSWATRFYSEQFLLAAFLLGGASGWEVVLPAYYASTQPDLRAIVARLIETANVGPGHDHGCGFWMRRL